MSAFPPSGDEAIAESRLRASLDLHPILQGVDAACINQVIQSSRVTVYDPGQTLSYEGEPALYYWLLCSGSVRVYYSSPNGLEVTVKLFGAPAAWAEMQVLHGYVHTENCVAVDRATVLRLPKVDFEKILDAHPRFLKNVLLDTSARFLIAAQHERALAFLSVPERLAYLMLSYHKLYGVPVEGGTMIRIRLSQDELANGLGVVRKSVTRALNDWVRNGILEKRGMKYVICDVASLERLAPKSILGIDWIAGRKLNSR